MTVKYNKCVESNNTSRGNDEKKGAFVGTTERTRITHGIVCAHLFVVFIMTSFVVCGDDTNAIRDTLSSLCSLNSVGKFASCCKEYPIGSISFSRRDSWSCYANDMRTNNGGDLLFLFVLSRFIQSNFHTFYTGISHLRISLILESTLFPVSPILFLFLSLFFLFPVLILLLSLKGDFPIAMPKGFYYGLTNLVSFQFFCLYFVELFQLFRSMSVKNLFGVTKEPFLYIQKLRSLFVHFITITQR